MNKPQLGKLGGIELYPNSNGTVNSVDNQLQNVFDIGLSPDVYTRIHGVYTLKKPSGELLSPHNIPLSSPADSGPKKPLGTIAQSSSHEKKNSTYRRRIRRLNSAARKLPGERVSVCQRCKAPMRQFVGVDQMPSSGESAFTGQIVCKSYSCPVCANWRTEADRRELDVALAEIHRQGFFPVMITCTVQHYAGMALEPLRAALRKAFDKTFSGRWYDQLCADYGIIGKVTAVEVTFGKNGWHPHIHTIIAMSLELTGKWLDEFTDHLRERWIQQLRKLGHTANWENGLDVQTADSEIASYIAKWGHEPSSGSWGAAHEMTKGAVKTGRLDGMTPFELLDAYDGDSDALERLQSILPGADADRAGDLYAEYFFAMKGRSPLHWGESLKARLDLASAWRQAEQQRLAEPQPEVITVATVAPSGWARLWKLNLAPELKELAATGDPYALEAFFAAHDIEATVTNIAYQRWHAAHPPGQAVPYLPALIGV